MTVKIVLVGRPGTGKTWIANYLRYHHGFKLIKFRSILDQFIKSLYDYRGYRQVRWETRRVFYDAWYKVDPNVWVGHVKWRVGKSSNDIVIDDPRYINEILELKSIGFIVIRVTSPETRINRRIRSYKQAAKGFIDVHDIYNKSFDETIGADYAIYNEDRETTKKLLDELVEKIKRLDIEKNSSS